MQKCSSTPDRGQRGGFIKTESGNSIRGHVSAMVVAVTVAAIAMLLIVSAVAGVRVWAAEPTVSFTPADGGTVNDATVNITISFGADVYSDVACSTELDRFDIDDITDIRVGNSRGTEILHSTSINQGTNIITLEPWSDLPEGMIYVGLSAGWSYMDADNNNQCTIGTAKSASFTVTTTPTGTITIGQVAGDDVVNGTEDDSDIVVSGSSTGLITGTTVTVDLDGNGVDVSGKTGTTDTSGVWSVTVTSAEMIGLGEGSVTITAMAPGAATDGTRTVTYDATAPTAMMSGMPSGTADTVMLDVTVGGADVTHYRHKVAEGTACTTGEYGSETAVATNITDDISALADGPVVLCVLGRDSAGNYQMTATEASWTKDDGGGTVPIDPIDPVDPVDPTDPVDPVDPTDPAVSPKMISIGTVAGDDMIDITEAASDVVVSGTANGLDGKKITIIFEDGDVDMKPDVIKKTRINSGDWSVTLSHTDIDTLENGFITVIAMTIDGGKYQADRKTIVLDRQGLLNLTQ